MMKSICPKLKSLDFFSRPQETLEKQTFIGAIITIISTIMILYFSTHVFCEAFLSKQFHKDFSVSHPSSESRLEVSVDILFRKVPCSAINLIHEDIVLQQPFSIKFGIYPHRLSANGTNIIPETYISDEISNKYPSEDEKIQMILTGLADHEQCRFKAKFDVSITPGVLRFNHQLSQAYLSRIKQLEPSLYNQLNLASHQIYTLSFSDLSNALLYSPKGFKELKKFNSAAGLLYPPNDTDQSQTSASSCLYYIKLIPQTTLLNEYTSYHYSYHRHCYVFFTWIY